jgi:hypothetical protein
VSEEQDDLTLVYMCGFKNGEQGMKAEIERLRAALNADAQTLRLHLGEMTAQEMRTVRAAFSWVLAGGKSND